MQQNDRGSFLPSVTAAVKSAMNDIIFGQLARLGRGKVEVESSVEFNLRRLAISGNEVRTFQKLQGLL